MTEEQRLAMRQARAKPLWEELHVWLRLERGRVPEGSAIAGAIDYSLNAWAALTANLHDGMVQVDNNHIENLMRPWAITGSFCACRARSRSLLQMARAVWEARQTTVQRTACRR